MKHLMLKTIILSMLLSLSSPSLSANINEDNVGLYNSCELIDNGDGTSTATVNVSYYGYLHTFPMEYRAVVLFFYDKDGRYFFKPLSPGNISLGATKSVGYEQVGLNAYYGSQKGDWKKVFGFTTDFTVIVPNNYFDEWNAISLRLADRDIRGDYYVENRGAAYLTYDNNGSCQIIDPIDPPDPEPNVKFEFTLPQLWDLKEIPPGISEVSFSGVRSEEFCIKYDNKQTSDTQFLMTVNSSNEKESNFNLINKLTPEDVIKYKLLLSDGGHNLLFPSNSGNSLSLIKMIRRFVFFQHLKLMQVVIPKKVSTAMYLILI
ncbi:hypothetical protein M2263_004570 [Providencia alcalifaciens]|nr:hypothetical protein [Providencia alcalifaciens]